jgi:hypothetical protein
MYQSMKDMPLKLIEITEEDFLKNFKTFDKTYDQYVIQEKFSETIEIIRKQYDNIIPEIYKDKNRT